MRSFIMDLKSSSLMNNNINNKSSIELTEEKSEINLEEVKCEICLNVLIFPVTLPCGHELCLDCYKKSVQLVNLLCPYCRQRISCWARKANKDNKVVNWQKWHLIQSHFPELVKSQMQSNDSNEELDYIGIHCEPISRVISSAGEIRKEFEHFSQMEIERQLAEEESTKRFIEKLLAEEQQMVAQNKHQLQEETANDEEIARTLQQYENRSIKTLRNRTVL